MPNLRDLRLRIRSVKNTAQITKAMQMVSATKMRRAQTQAVSARPYISTLSQILGYAADRIVGYDHPLLKENESSRIGVILLTTDKGLCGSLNTNILRLVQTSPELSKQSDITFFTLGRKGRDFLVRTQKNLEADFENPERIEFKQAISLRRMIVEAFTSGKIGKAYILYPEFISTLRQEPRLIRLLPIDQDLLTSFLQQFKKEELSADYLFEPQLSEVLDYALTHFLDTKIYQCLLETNASEHSARMMAMQNATDNAKELVTDLQLTYNQARQSAITTQILEIASAGAALE